MAALTTGKPVVFVQHFVQAVRFRVVTLQLHQVTAVLYAAFALAILVAPQYGAPAWLMRAHGLSADLLAYLFLLSAGIIGRRKRSVRIFALCLTPLVLWGALSFAYAADTGVSSLGTILFFTSSEVGLLLLLYARRIGPLHFSDVWIASMLLLGGSFVADPDKGAMLWISQTYPLLSGTTIGLAFIIAALLIAFTSDHRIIILASTIFSLYALMVCLYAASMTTRGPASAVGALTLLTTVAWGLLNPSVYWSDHHEPH